MANDNEALNLEILTENNRKELLKGIDLVLEQYAYSTKSIVTVWVNNLEELDLLLKFIKIAEQLGAVENLLNSSSEKGYPISYYLRVRHDEILKLQKTLIDSIANTEQQNNQPRTDFTAKLSLNSANRTIRLTSMGTTRNVHKFRSKLDANYVMFRNLYLRPNQPLTKKDMGAPRALSVIKDLPKTMCFCGDLKGIFFTIDTKNQTLTLHPEKTLTDDESETLNQYVNS